MNQTNSINKYLRVIGKRAVFIMFFTVGISQWTGYDVNQEEFSSADLRIFIESTTFGLSANPSLILSPENKVNIGVGLSNNTLLRSNMYQHQISGLVPKFSADVFITNNLYFIGRLSQFYSDENIIHFQNFGFALTSGEEDSYPWQTSLVFCNLAGPRDFALRSVSLIMTTLVEVADYQFQVGLGKEMYSATFSLNDVNFPSKMKGEINYLLLGMEFERDTFRIIPHIRFHPKLIGTSVRINWGIN